MDESSMWSQSFGIWTKDTTDAMCSVDEDKRPKDQWVTTARKEKEN